VSNPSLIELFLRRISVKGLHEEVERCPFSVRVHNALDEAGIATLTQLAATPKAELLKMRNFGASSMAEVEIALERFGKEPRATQPSTACRFASCDPCVNPSTECHGFCDMTAARNFVDALDDLSIERLVQAGLERGRVGDLDQRVRSALMRLDLRREQEAERPTQAHRGV
jgi:hypothetical protein